VGEDGGRTRAAVSHDARSHGMPPTTARSRKQATSRSRWSIGHRAVEEAGYLALSVVNPPPRGRGSRLPRALGGQFATARSRKQATSRSRWPIRHRAVEEAGYLALPVVRPGQKRRTLLEG
jgi:hypothetical protein